jgi:hypothetical protein
VVVGSDLGFLAGRGTVSHSTAIRADARLDEPGHACQTAFLEAARASGAEAVDLGLGAGEAGGPKAGIGPDRVVHERFLVGSSPRRQRLLAALIRLRSATRRGEPG